MEPPWISKGTRSRNATVTLGNYTAVTTSEIGFFRVLRGQGGNYSLTVTKDGFSTITQNVTAASGQNANLDSIVLQAADASTSSGSGSGDMTLIIVIVVVAVAAAVAVYFLFFRKR